jgi:hypothetical protein
MNSSTKKPAPARHPLADLREGVGGLRSAVSDLLATYERLPVLNELQPRSLSGCYAASLDEWARALWYALGDIEALESMFAELAALGFESEVGGGGCLFLSTYRGGGAVYLTSDGGGGMPSPESWMVGAYPPPGPDGEMPEALWTLSSDSACEADTGRARLLAAAAAAVATIDGLANVSPMPWTRRMVPGDLMAWTWDHPATPWAISKGWDGNAESWTSNPPWDGRAVTLENELHLGRAEYAARQQSGAMIDALRFYAGWGIDGPAHDDKVSNDGGDMARAVIARIEGGA